MIQGYSALSQALFGSLFTWFVTALGAACVFLFNKPNQKLLDSSLGFAAGVMTAASYWSLLAPALEIAERQFAHWALLPVAGGFFAGAAFVYLADHLMSCFGIGTDDSSVVAILSPPLPDAGSPSSAGRSSTDNNNDSNEWPTSVRLRGKSKNSKLSSIANESPRTRKEELEAISLALSWRRALLLIIAVTVHNIPEGLAVGVGFGAIDKSPSATFESARNLALGIGIQNFPEGLAVSVPLAGFGYSKWRSFMYGQLSGMVEPVAAVFGALAVSFMEPILAFSLSLAAGAMIYVVVDDIVPEAHRRGNGKLASWGAIVGFSVMMSLDVGLG